MSRARWALPILTVALATGAASPCGSQAASAFSFQPQLGLPGNVILIGASPGQAPGEVWATAAIGAVPATAAGGQQIKDATVLLRRTQGSGWQIVPVADPQGDQFDFSGAPAVTNDGGVAMLNADATTILMHDPTGAFAQAPAPGVTPAPGAVLDQGETLSGGDLAALDEAAHAGEPAHTGALIVPAGLSPADPGVLHYDGAQWTRESICTQYAAAEPEPCTHTSKLSVKAIAASSPQNAWLLASAPGNPWCSSSGPRSRARRSGYGASRRAGRRAATWSPRARAGRC